MAWFALGFVLVVWTVAAFAYRRRWLDARCRLTAACRKLNDQLAVLNDQLAVEATLRRDLASARADIARLRASETKRDDPDTGRSMGDLLEEEALLSDDGDW